MLFSPFERRAFGGHAVAGFDGWLVKPVRARSLYERLAEQFPQSRLAEASAAAKPAATRHESARALVAEDNDINFVIAQKALRRLGFEIERAQRRARGRAHGRRRGARQGAAFDLVLMDIKMPGLDGRQAVREIREIERETGTPPVAVVALTANAAAQDQRAALGGGGGRISGQAVRSAQARRSHRARAGAARRAGGGAALVIIPFVSHAEDARERGPSTWVIRSFSRARAIWR